MLKAPSKNLFRVAAIEHYLADEELGGHIGVTPPWTWGLLVAVGGAVTIAVVGSILVSVEVTATARGMLRPAGGIRPLTAQVDGTVAGVLVRSGDSILAGAPVAHLESAPIRAQLLEAESEVQSLEFDQSSYLSRQDEMVAEQRRLLHARLASLEEEAESQRSSVALYERKLRINSQLLDAGLLSAIVVEDSREALALSRRQVGSTNNAILQTRQELAALEMRRQQDLWTRQRALLSARTRLSSMRTTVRQLEILATASGTLEAILIRPGDAVQVGETIGRVVPDEGDLQMVSFLPERDRAFLNVTDRVRVEFDQLPASEFGSFEGHIVRIGRDLASAAEIRESMGESAGLVGPTCRVEIKLERGGVSSQFRLRTGMLADVRYTLRRQRLVTLIVEPLSRWIN